MSGSDYHRIVLPHRHLELQEGDQVFSVTQKDHLYEEIFAKVDIVIFSRECPFDLNQIITFRDKYRFKIVVDVDDYWQLYPLHYLYETWMKNKVEHEIKKAMIVADVVTTTHDQLADQARAFASRVVVLPNALPYGEDQFYKNGSAKKRASFIYVAGASHLQDLRSISQFLGMCRGSSLTKEFPLILAGYNDQNEDSKRVWEKMTRVASIYGELLLMRTLPLSSYMNHYNYSSLAIAPLAKHHPFNTFKSNLKILEAGCKALPIICSAIHPYAPDETQGVTLCKTHKDWFFALSKYLKNPEKMKEDGEALYQYVTKKYNLIDVNKRRMDLYRNLYNEKQRSFKNSGGD